MAEEVVDLVIAAIATVVTVHDAGVLMQQHGGVVHAIQHEALGTVVELAVAEGRPVDAPVRQGLVVHAVRVAELVGRREGAGTVGWLYVQTTIG